MGKGRLIERTERLDHLRKDRTTTPRMRDERGKEDGS